jgi:MinD superfamily P-loop ATPase
MKQIVVLSGKGGTGKTTVAAALAPLAARELTIVLADADVDASNLQLLLAPTVREENPFMAGEVGVIEPELCEGCGICMDACRFDAIGFSAEAGSSGVCRIDPIACEGCAACRYACPIDSIRMDTVQSGLWFRSDTRFGPLFHARLFAGRENSGKLVSVVKQKAAELAAASGAALVLVDGPPGIGCPVISAISGADLALIVAEPTVSGEHDLERVIGVAKHFGVPSAVVINKADLNPARAGAIDSFCRAREVAVLGRIPYDPVVTESIVQGLPLTEFRDDALTDTLVRIWHRLRDLLHPTPTVAEMGPSLRLVPSRPGSTH